jgi:segregation and condensation protein B
MKNEDIERTLQALLFTSDKPVPANVLSGVLEIETKEIDLVVERVNVRLRDSGSPVMIKQIAGGYEFLTLPEFAPYIKKLYKNRYLTRLSRAALEVLAIIAYKQPITKQEVEAIRGVNSDGVYHTLLERKLIKIAGRKEAPGRPLLYGSTREFLQYLGINSMEDLPKIEEIKSILEKDEFVESWEDRIETAKNQAIFEFNQEDGKQGPAVKVTTLEEDLAAMKNEEKTEQPEETENEDEKDEATGLKPGEDEEPAGEDDEEPEDEDDEEDDDEDDDKEDEDDDDDEEEEDEEDEE